jgi:predicted nicotinamide N-methyase
MRAAVSGTRVNLSWRPNTSGGDPTDYVLYVGTYSWGTNILRGRSLGDVLSVSSDLRNGTYYARVRARNAYGISRSSQQVSFRVGRQLASPTGLTANWSGTQTTLSWVASSADSPDLVPTNYVLEAGTAPGLADVAAIPLGTSTSFSADVQTGVYYVRVRATNDIGDSDPTPDIVVAAPGTAQAPTTLTSGGEGSTVTLTWAPPAGEPVAGYVIEAGSDPGLSDIAVLPVGNVTTFTTEAPPGTYFVRVRAINAKGPGLPSNEVVVEK